MHTTGNERCRELHGGAMGNGPVIYWMAREHRADDNWALDFAQEFAATRRRPLLVLIAIDPEYPGATWRQYDFLLEGLRQTEQDLKRRHIPMMAVMGEPALAVPPAIKDLHPAAVVMDFDPLKVEHAWEEAIVGQTSAAVWEVDSRNIVPCRHVSNKLEVGARTLRPKIEKLLPDFLERQPGHCGRRHPYEIDLETLPYAVDWRKIRRMVKASHDVAPIEGVTPVAKAANERLMQFLGSGIHGYARRANDPNDDARSRLSPYLHFGQISAQRVAIEVRQSDAAEEDKEAFLEQLIVRRELSDNFCLYEPNYDSAEGFPTWARESLDSHRNDRREYLYSREQFEHAQTHDPLWNAAQNEMLSVGLMHGYMRMYWAKKIAEWTESPEEAMATAIYLNDRYSLDGCDTNGYTGIAWAIGGVHDRAFGARPVTGKVRCMTADGAERKFDVQRYIERWTPEPVGA